MLYPNKLFSGYHGNGSCHCQGIAVDTEKGYIYYSFTTRLVKMDFEGNVIGSVKGLIGHLGCISFCKADRKIYGSLEFKNDSIGKGILSSLGLNLSGVTTAFYCAVFDVDKIDRPDMDAEKDGIMRAVYLKDVIEDFDAEVTVNGKKYPHKYACSGVDGLSFGPAFDGSGKTVLCICYGIYGDIEREDNDYQVILCFDATGFWDMALPLRQDNMHQNGIYCQNKYFLYTGNTRWGVQNLEYDPYTETWLACVYKGEKPKFPNYSLFMIDSKKPPIKEKHIPYGEDIEVLSLANEGSYFPLGATGVYSFGNGYFYFSKIGTDAEKGQYTDVFLYRYDNGEFTAADSPMEF